MPALFVFPPGCGNTDRRPVLRVEIQERFVEAGSGAISLFVVVLVLVCLLAFFIRKGGKKPVKRASPSPETGIPQGLEEEYRCGVDPCGCGVPVMYTLHTCRHCVRLKDFLEKNGIDHKLIYVDDFADPARREIMTTLRSHNPRGSFPTLVVPDGRSVVGFREDAVRSLLGLE